LFLIFFILFIFFAFFKNIFYFFYPEPLGNRPVPWGFQIELTPKLANGIPIAMSPFPVNDSPGGNPGGLNHNEDK
jgi:hypothetical protein